MLKRLFLAASSALCLLLLLGACHRAVSGAAPVSGPAPTSGSPRQLRFGSGGGFTGAVTTYVLYADGRLERRMLRPGADTTQPATLVTTAPADRVRACFRGFDALPADSTQLNQAGNMTTFIEGRTAVGRSLRLTWGAPGAPVPHAVRALYRDLTALVPRQ